MRSPYAEPVAVPRTLAQLMAEDVPREPSGGSRRRPRKVRTLRRAAA